MSDIGEVVIYRCEHFIGGSNWVQLGARNSSEASAKEKLCSLRLNHPTQQFRLVRVRIERAVLE